MKLHKVCTWTPREWHTAHRHICQPAEGRDSKGIPTPMSAHRNWLPEKPGIKRFLNSFSFCLRGAYGAPPVSSRAVAASFTHTFHSWLHQRKWGKNDSISSTYTPSMTHMAFQPRQLSTSWQGQGVIFSLWERLLSIRTWSMWLI